MRHFLILLSFSAAASIAQAQTVDVKSSAAAEQVLAQMAVSGNVPEGTTTGPGAKGPQCFEPVNQGNGSLVNALRGVSLLCPNILRAGTPVRVLANRGALSAEATGVATAWMRDR